MKATAILRNLSDTFWNGSEHFPTPGFLTQNPKEQWARVLQLCRERYSATLKIETGQFRDQVELNQILRGEHTIACTVEPRRGYKLATFTIERA